MRAPRTRDGERRRRTAASATGERQRDKKPSQSMHTTSFTDEVPGDGANGLQPWRDDNGAHPDSPAGIPNIDTRSFTFARTVFLVGRMTVGDDQRCEIASHLSWRCTPQRDDRCDRARPTLRRGTMTPLPLAKGNDLADRLRLDLNSVLEVPLPRHAAVRPINATHQRSHQRLVCGSDLE